MVRDIYQAGVRPFKYIVADRLYGNSPDFWEACDASVGTVAFVATPADTRCWLQPLATQRHTYRYRGEERTKRVVATRHTPPRSMQNITAHVQGGVTLKWEFIRKHRNIKP
jgi:hypothetical protein